MSRPRRRGVRRFNDGARARHHKPAPAAATAAAASNALRCVSSRNCVLDGLACAS